MRLYSSHLPREVDQKADGKPCGCEVRDHLADLVISELVFAVP